MRANGRAQAKLLGATMLGVMPWAGIATAQTAPPTSPNYAVEEVVVTARQRAETLQDVPLSINTFAATQIEREHVETFTDIARLSPSLVFDKGFSLQDTRPVIRGLPSSRGRPPVGVLIDGVDTSSESMGSSAGGSNLLNLRSLDVDRIEVVKGPQSALYGRVAFGGAINYITKQPSHTFGAELGGEAGDFGTYEVRGAVTGPINDALALRVNGYHAESAGDFTNQISGKRINGYDSSGGGVAISFRPDSRFDALVNLGYNDDRYSPAAQYDIGFRAGVDVTTPLPAGIAGVIVGTGAGAPLPATVTGPPRGYLTAPPTGIRLSLNPLTGTDYPGSHLVSRRAVLHMNYDFGWATLSSITSLLHATFAESEDTDFFGAQYAPVTSPPPGGLAEPLPRAQQSNLSHGDVTQWNQEVRLGNLTGGPFRWAVGALYWFEKYKQDNQSATYVVSGTGSAGLDILDDSTSLPNGPGVRSTRHESVYALLEYDFLRYFTASYEGRYASESYNYIFSPYLGTVGTGAAGPAPVAVLAQPLPRSTSTDYLTPKFLLRYTPSSDLMFYASAAKGIKPAGYSTVAVIDSSTAKFNTEKLWNYEVGTKARFFERKVSVEAAAFYMDYTNKQISLVVPNALSPTGFSSVIANAGGAEVKGLEAEVSYQPIRDLFLSVAYTYLDATYTDYVVNANSGLVGSLLNNCKQVTIGSGLFCQGNLKGDRLERSPNHSVVAQGRYAHPVTGELRAFIEGDLRYTGDRPVEEYNKFFIPASATLDLRLGIEHQKASAFIYVNNVFDDNHIVGAIFVGDTFLPGSAAIIAQPNDPRRIGVRFNYKY